METPELGSIKKVSDLREAWPNEAGDFTPWLADNISELGDALGLDLELQAQEAPVGTFSLDLLAHETGKNRAVIIENQLEQTNHDHLGKLLTYAGGYDADIAVWIARDFRDEHRQALDWLNQRTDEETAFFGVVIELWKIDGSRPAPHFNIIAAPNEWQKETVRNVQEAKISEKSLRYQRFFQELMDALRERGFTNARKAQPYKSSYGFSAGHAGRVKYNANFAQGRRARVEVYIDSTDKDWNDDLFDRLMERKESIESDLSESLEWERLDNRRASRISVAREGGIDDEETLEEIKNWMIEKLLDFRRVFGPILDELAS